MRVFAIILAAGKGERFGGDKVLYEVGGKPLWRHSFDAFQVHPGIDGVGIVASAQNLLQIAKLATEAAFVVRGGENRQESSLIGIDAVPDDFEIVLIHDAARPIVSARLIDRVIEGIKSRGAAAPGIPLVDTIRMKAGLEWGVCERADLVAMQTPQGGFREALLTAHRAAGRVVTDDMEVLADLGLPFSIVEGDPMCFKVTTAEDFERLYAIMHPLAETRTGLGYDIHAFSADPHRPLMLGGIEFPGPGLDGHSDADVILHAVTDAVLGGAGLGDIGQHFPNTDPKFKDMASIGFLEFAVELASREGWRVSFMDVCFLSETPKIMPRASEMKVIIAKALGVGDGAVNIKATTQEKLGAIGRKEGAAAFATATLLRSSR